MDVSVVKGAMQLKSSGVPVSGVCTGHCGGKGRWDHTTFAAQTKNCFCERNWRAPIPSRPTIKTTSRSTINRFVIPRFHRRLSYRRQHETAKLLAVHPGVGIFRSQPLTRPPTAIMPRGLNAARKLRDTRRSERWADLHFKKRALGTAYVRYSLSLFQTRN